MPAMTMYTSNDQPWCEGIRVEKRYLFCFTDRAFVVAGFFQAFDQRCPKIDVAGIDLNAFFQNLRCFLVCADCCRQVSKRVGRFRVSGLS